MSSLICTTFVLRGNARKRPGRFPLMTGPFSGGTRGAGPPPPAGRLLVLLRLARATLLILPCLRVVKLVVFRFWGALRREAGTDDRGHQDSCVYFNVTLHMKQKIEIPQTPWSGAACPSLGSRTLQVRATFARARARRASHVCASC